MLKKLQSMGLSLHADLNAQTKSAETIFKFDLPENDKATIDNALFLTRQIASAATLSPKAIQSERLVVLAELRQRDTPALHTVEADLAATLGGRIAGAMLPNGKTGVEAATSQMLRSFYRAPYRPDRATLLIVGDVDPTAVAKQIAARFSSWQAAAPEPVPPVYQVSPARTAQFATYTEAGAPSALSLSWAVPHDAAPDSVAKERREITQLIGLTVLNQRLRKLAQSDAAPFLAAAAQWHPLADLADVTEIDARVRNGGALTALGAVQSAYTDIARDGVRPDEVNQAVRRLRAYFQAEANAAGTIPSPQLATVLMSSIDENSVLTSPGQDLALYEGIVKNLTAADVSAAVKTLFTATAPSVFVSGSTPLPGGKAALAAAFAKGAHLQHSAAAAPIAATKTWPYTSFGPAGKVVSRKQVADLGITFVTFANGVRATIKPTTFEKGQILVSARFGYGRMGLAKTHPSPVWAANGALMLGGLNRISLDDMQSLFAGRVVQGALQTQDDAFALGGKTQPQDLDAELQLLAAYVSDPAWRPLAFQRTQAATEGVLEQFYSTPGGVLKLRFNQIVHGDDPRYASPTAATVRSTSLADVKALLQAPLASGPLNVIVVGDVSVDAAVKAIAASFGALPKRPARAVPASDERTPPPAAKPVTYSYNGSGHQAYAVMGWRTPGFFPDTQTPRTLRVLSRVLEHRLFDTLRTAQGVTYTPQTMANASPLSSSFGYIVTFANVPAQKTDAFYATVASVAKSLATKPISQAELTRARGPLVNDLDHKQQTNAYWITTLADAEADPRRLDLLRSITPDLKRVTIAEVQAAAKRYLTPAGVWKAVIAPPSSGVTQAQAH